MKSPIKNKDNGELKPKPQKKSPTVAASSAAKGKIVKKKPKAKKSNTEKAALKQAAVAETSPKELTAKDIAKIEKKKAKKQAQKIKKQINKSTGTVEAVKEAAATKAEAKSDKKKKIPPVKKAEQPNKKKELKKSKAKAAKESKANKDDSEDAVKRERNPAAEAATVFVGNMPINTKRVQLVRLFQPYGVVQSIRLRTAGGKQLFKHKQRKDAGSLNAYVVFESAEIAAKALEVNGAEFKGNHLRVTPAAKTHEGAEGGGPNDADAKRTIFVGSLKYSANEQKLREIFSSCGEIEYIRCLQDGEKGCKGVAYVCFQKADAVGLALELNETMLDERPIHVERYSVKKLGAKQARDATAAAKPKSKGKTNAAGAKKRIDKKQRKENGKPTENKTGANKKKSEYRGVKVDGTKSKSKKTKKRSNDSNQTLAKKIAPKVKN